MAKRIPKIRMEGPYVVLRLVKSRKYGDHYRAARGTYKKAKLNAACKKNGKELLRANGPAKMIQDALRPYRIGFYDGTMWSRLLKLMKKAQGGKKSVDFNMLRRFDINEDYPLQRLFVLKADAKVDDKKSTLEVRFAVDAHPDFGKRIRVNGYRFSLVGIFPDMKKLRADTESSESDMIKFENVKPPPVTLQIPIPPRAKTFLACLRVDGLWKGKPHESRASQGMAIVAVGEV